MKSLALVIIVLVMLGCAESASIVNLDPLPEDSVSVALLIVDYETHVFEGGNLSFYPQCAECDTDQIPVNVDYDPPGDFGSINFLLDGSGASVFEASIIWMGTGSIVYPAEWLPPKSFGQMAPVLFPEDPEYFGPFAVPFDDEFRDGARRAWAAVSSLDIVARFRRPSARVGFYLYPPTVGLFDPTKARWIIFLYSPGKVAVR